MSKFKKTRKVLGATSDGSKPSDPKLYAQVTAEAKSKFEKWPSAYASSWVVKTYKERGGKYVS